MECSSSRNHIISAAQCSGAWRGVIRQAHERGYGRPAWSVGPPGSPQTPGPSDRGGPPAAFLGPGPSPKASGEAPDQFAPSFASNGAILSRLKPDLIFSGPNFRNSGPGFGLKPIKTAVPRLRDLSRWLRAAFLLRVGGLNASGSLLGLHFVTFLTPGRRKRGPGLQARGVGSCVPRRGVSFRQK